MKETNVNTFILYQCVKSHAFSIGKPLYNQCFFLVGSKLFLRLKPIEIWCSHLVDSFFVFFFFVILY